MKINLNFCKHQIIKKTACIKKYTEVNYDEVADILKKERMTKKSMEDMEIILGKMESNKMFVVMNIVNTDCLSEEEILEIIDKVKMMEKELSAMLDRDCRRNQPTVSR